MDIRNYSMTQIAKMIRNGEVSSEVVVRACLEQCKKIKEYNAFISLYEDQSIALAKAYDSMIAAGYVIGPLHGVPIALKDNIYLENEVTTAGSSILENTVSHFDATVAKKLKGAGAIIIGKTNMHEFAWGATTENPHYGIAHNPWAYEKNPAGSSGGSGIAVSSRCCYGALGTDTGGSVRLPSSVNGITGIRPTIGRVSNFGVVPLAYSQDTVGPMCRTVEDCAYMLNVIAGYDYYDKSSSKMVVEDYTSDLDRGIAGFKVGVIKDYCFEYNQPDVEKCYREALDKLQRLGASVIEIELPDLDILIGSQLIVDAVEPSAFHMNWLRQYPEKYGEDVRVEMEAGAMFTGTQYVQALAYRSLLKSHIEDAFKDVDVVVTPTIPFTALKIGSPVIELAPGIEEDALAAILHYTAIPSITGKPALDIPAGFDQDGMPIGIMIIGDSYQERMLFRVGNAFQKSTNFHLKAPEIANV